MSDEMNAVPNVNAEGKTTETEDVVLEKPMVKNAAIPDAPAEVGGRDEVDAPVIEKTLERTQPADAIQTEIEDNPWVNDSEQKTELTEFAGHTLAVEDPEQKAGLVEFTEDKSLSPVELDDEGNPLVVLEEDQNQSLVEFEENPELSPVEPEEAANLALAEEQASELAAQEAEVELAGADVVVAAAKAANAQETAQKAVKEQIAATKEVHKERDLEINDTRVNFQDAGDVAEYVSSKGNESQTEALVNNTVADAQNKGLDQKDAERVAMSQVASGDLGSLEGTGNDRMNETQDRSRVKAVARAGAAGGVQAAQNEANKYAEVEIKEQQERSEEITQGEKAANAMETGSQNMANLSDIDANNIEVGDIEAVANNLEAAALPEAPEMEALEANEHESLDPALLEAATMAQTEMLQSMEEHILAIEASNELEQAPELGQEIDFASLEAANKTIDNTLDDPQLAIGGDGGRSR